MSIDKLPVLPGLEVVVVRAQSVEQVEGSEAGGGPVGAVVGLQVSLGWAPLGRARRVEPFESRLLISVGAPPEMGDTSDGVGLGEYGGDKGIPGVKEIAYDRDGDRAVADEFAGFTGCGDATKPGVVVNA